VADVFDDMILRSIPQYADVQRCLPLLADQLPQDPLLIVDLGCSTGTSLIGLETALRHRPLQLVGVDNSAAMIAKCSENIRRHQPTAPIELYTNDIQRFEFRNASMVLMNYTLQFVDPERRPELLSRIRRSIRPGGMLIVSEKLVQRGAEAEALATRLYVDFKKRQGYSELEIARKRDALENVLVPWSLEENISLLTNAGFRSVDLLLKWFNFASFVCR
jgi:tRNA (cmo5U34)-methyltransferase